MATAQSLRVIGLGSGKGLTQFCLLLCVLLTAGLAVAAEKDVEGSKDYPGIGRFAASAITGYEVKDFDETKIQAAAFKDGQAVEQRKLERSPASPIAPGKGRPSRKCSGILKTS